MARIMILGAGADDGIAVLSAAGHAVISTPDEATVRAGGWTADLVVAVLSEEVDVQTAAAAAHAARANWVAWIAPNSDARLMAAEAQRLGATAVCPRVDGADRLRDECQRVLLSGARICEFEAGEDIDLGTSEVLLVHHGTVAVQVLPHSAAAPVLVGVCGAGDLQPGGHRVRVRAASDVTGERRPWDAVAAEPVTAERLRRRLERAQQWIATASPNTEISLTNLLAELADEHGIHTTTGVWLPLTLPRHLLAGPLGCTPQTASHLIARLKRAGQLDERPGHGIRIRPAPHAAPGPRPPRVTPIHHAS